MTQLEYGAQLVSRAANVYIKDFDQAVVLAWMEDMAGVTPMRLVMRVWDGATHGGWIPMEVQP